MKNNKEALIRDILESSSRIFNIIKPRVPLDCLSSDLTVAQLRVLLLLYSDGPAHMSAIASQLGVALSSATGIVDNLVKKEMVFREADSLDRRLVVCKLAPAGEDLTGRLWSMGELQLEQLLEGLTPGQLEKSAQVARMLLDNITGKFK